MKKSYITLLVIGLFASSVIYSQTTETEKKLRSIVVDTIKGWKTTGLVNLGISQTSLTNWASGGQNSIAINGLLSLTAHYHMKKALFENYLDLGYGMIKQGRNASWLKSDDKIDFLTKFGQKITNKSYLAALANFKSQMTDGFNYPNDSVRISGLLAPAYILVAMGIESKPNASFSAFFAPITAKITLVNDQTLANAGGFGVEKAVLDTDGVTILVPGEKSRFEFGGYVRLIYKKEIMTNITFQTKLDLFSNYLNNPTNIDVNWETLFNMKVNKYISVTLGTHLVYDDDIDIMIDNNDDGVIDEVGPRIQFKEFLNAGLSYKF